MPHDRLLTTQGLINVMCSLLFSYPGENKNREVVLVSFCWVVGRGDDNRGLRRRRRIMPEYCHKFNYYGEIVIEEYE